MRARVQQKKKIFMNNQHIDATEQLHLWDKIAVVFTEMATVNHDDAQRT